MTDTLYDEFLDSSDTLRIYSGNSLVFTSTRERLLPLVEYIDGPASGYNGVTIFDRIVGNAAALLSIKAGCGHIFSPVGSRMAQETLDTYGIRHQLNSIVPYIRRADRDEMCPMESLSKGKSPEEFYTALKARIQSG